MELPMKIKILIPVIFIVFLLAVYYVLIQGRGILFIPFLEPTTSNFDLPITSSSTEENPALTQSDENVTINEELRDVNFCGKHYKMKQIFIKGVDVGQKIAEIMNSNYYNDTFPKLGSGDEVYRDMTEFSQNMRYSLRPYIISKTACDYFSKTNTSGLLEIKESNIKDWGIVVNIFGVSFSSLLDKKIDNLYVTFPSGIMPDDGAYPIKKDPR